MITIREIADVKTDISSTRWAFAAIVKADIAIVSITLVAAIAILFFYRFFNVIYYWI